MSENKTAKTPTDSGVGFIDGVWYGLGPTAWQCQCGKPYTVTSTPSCRTIRNCLIVASGWISPSAYSRFRCSLMAELIEQALKEKNHG